MNFKQIVFSIFYSLIDKFQLKVIKEDSQSILLKNNHCYLFIGQQMGEVYVHFRKNEEDEPIYPFMWAVLSDKFDYKLSIPISFDPSNELIKNLEYLLVKDYIIISLFCSDLLEGDFSKLSKYRDNYQVKNKEIYDFRKLNGDFN